MTSPALKFCPSTNCRDRRNTTIAVLAFKAMSSCHNSVLPRSVNTLKPKFANDLEQSEIKGSYLLDRHWNHTVVVMKRLEYLYGANNIILTYPSFMRDSPSMRVLNFLLAPSSFNNATTATGSVALSRPPSKSPVLQLQSYGNIFCSVTTIHFQALV
jgi:hypothetical protein